MESIKEFLESLFDNYRERIKSPFVGSFALSFMIYNWRPFTILFCSNWPIEKRIAWIDKFYCNRESFFTPLGIAFFYILILPYMNLFFEWCLEKYSNKKNVKKKTNRLDNLKQQKEEAILIREIADAEAGTSEINNLKLRNDSLVSDMDLLTEQYKTDIDRNKDLIENSKKSEELTKLELKKSNKEKDDLQKEYDKFRKNPRMLELPTRTMSLLEQLNIQDKLYFMDYCNSVIFQKVKIQIKNDSESILKFINLGLLTPPIPETNKRELTHIGTIVYQYIQNEFDSDVPF